MNKWVAIPVIIVLVLAVIAVGYLYLQQTNKLEEAESEIVALEGNVATLEGNVATLEGNVASLEGNVSTLEGNVATLEGEVSSLETELADSEAKVSSLSTELSSSKSKVSSLQSDLKKAKDDIETQQTINSALSGELKNIQYPRYFKSSQELADWLREDDTDTEYGDEDVPFICFILQIRALRDGYLLPAFVNPEGEDLYFSNWTVIGDEIYAVAAWDDSSTYVGYLYKPLPSYPLPMD